MTMLLLFVAVAMDLQEGRPDPKQLEDGTWVHYSEPPGYTEHRNAGSGGGTIKWEWVSCVGKKLGSRLGETSVGLSQMYETCSSAPQSDCENYFTFSSIYKRYVQCQASTIRVGLFARARNQPICTTGQNIMSSHRRHYDHDYKAMTGSGPESVKLCVATEHDGIGATLEEKRVEAQEACTATLCEFAKTGRWNGWKSSSKTTGLTKTWTRHVGGFNQWGWRHSARKKCPLSWLGFDVIDVEKLYAPLVDQGNLAEDTPFDKTQCGCESRDDCSSTTDPATLIDENEAAWQGTDSERVELPGPKTEHEPKEHFEGDPLLEQDPNFAGGGSLVQERVAVDGHISRVRHVPKKHESESIADMVRTSQA